MINGERVKQARELRGLTQTELADRIGKDQSAIARIERNGFQPSDEVLEAIAIQTGFPPSFFRRKPSSGFTAGSLQFRARRMSAGERTRAYQYAKTVWECVQMMADEITEIPVKLPKLDEPPDVAAAVTRAELGLSPDAPIPNVIDAVERAGVLVLTIPLPLEKWDAFCLWAGEETKQPVIVVASQAPGDRLRLSVSHELAHLVMHQSLQGELQAIEREASRFAGEFLMPEAAMRQEIVPPVTLTSLSELKPHWGVSIQALIYRARDLEIISERQRSYLFEQLSVRGWRKQEPSELAVAVEKPRAVRKMAELLYGDPIDYRRFAGDAGFALRFAEEIIDLHAGRGDAPTTQAHKAPDAGRLYHLPGGKKGSGLHLYSEEDC